MERLHVDVRVVVPQGFPVCCGLERLLNWMAGGEGREKPRGPRAGDVPIDGDPGFPRANLCGEELASAGSPGKCGDLSCVLEKHAGD